MFNEKVGGIDRWDVQSALNTLKRAEEIKTDKKMMKAVKIQARQDQKALIKIAGKKA